MITNLLLALNDHAATRPLALLLHLIIHLHRADDDCPRCIDAMR